MDRRRFLEMTAAWGGGLCLSRSAGAAAASPAKAHNPNTKWFRDAKCGCFTYFLDEHGGAVTWDLPLKPNRTCISTLHGTIGRAARTQELLSEGKLHMTSTRPIPDPRQQELKGTFWETGGFENIVERESMACTNRPLEDCRAERLAPMLFT